MDSSTIIIGLVCLAIIILPILYFQRNQKNKASKLFNEFSNLAGQQQLNISQYDFWDPFYAIGLDSDKMKLFYTKRRESVVQETVIDLLEVGQYRVSNTNRDTNGSKVIDYIELTFTYRNSKHPEKSLEFYNREENLILGGELRLAEKWKTIINTSLAAKQTSREILQATS